MAGVTTVALDGLRASIGIAAFHCGGLIMIGARSTAYKKNASQQPEQKNNLLYVNQLYILKSAGSPGTPS
jgi:hypothetical protein